MRQPVNSNAVDIKKTPEIEYSGIYVGHKEIDTKIGEQTLWQFNDSNGQPFSIYGFTNLNRAMESVGTGTFVYVRYMGTKNVKTAYGMKDVHQVNVEIEVADPLPEPK